MNPQDKLVEILKHKGIGPEGSKSLLTEQLTFLDTAFQDSNISLITRATLLTALLTLEPTEVEKAWIDQLHKTPEVILPLELLPFLEENPLSEFQRLINRCIKKEDINEDAQLAVEYCFDSRTPKHLTAAFLEAMRLKRETYIENRIFFRHFKKLSDSISTQLPAVVDICDSYDGVVRHHNYGVFSACVLAASGIPVVLHGVKSVAPKQGYTHHQILDFANKSTQLNLEAAKAKLENEQIAWAYVDQSQYFPALFKFGQLRAEMVKRPFIATFEKLLQPIRSLNGNFIVSSYTHKHYRMEVIELLREIGETNGVIHFKGIEATGQPNPSRKFEYLQLKGEEILENDIDPADYALEAKGPKMRKEDFSLQELVTLGREVLEGKQNDAYRFIYFQCALILKALGWSDTDIKTKIDKVLTNGEALTRWENY